MVHFGRTCPCPPEVVISRKSKRVWDELLEKHKKEIEDENKSLHSSLYCVTFLLGMVSGAVLLITWGETWL